MTATLHIRPRVYGPWSAWLLLACLICLAPRAARAEVDIPTPMPDDPPDETHAADPVEDPWDPRQTMELRNPFLPPGHRVRVRTPESDPDRPEADLPRGPTDAQWEAARATLRIRGISQLGNDIAALVNGRVLTAGETIEIMHDSHLFRWIVDDISLRAGLQLRRLPNREPAPAP